MVLNGNSFTTLVETPAPSTPTPVSESTPAATVSSTTTDTTPAATVVTTPTPAATTTTEDEVILPWSAEEEASLVRACETGDLAAVVHMLGRGANPHTRSPNGLPLIHLASNGGHTEIVKFLINLGAEVNSGDSASFIPLHYASYHGKYDTVVLLIEAGSEVDALGANGSSALHLASAGDHHTVAQYLLDMGAEKDRRNARNLRPIDLARSDAMKRLLENSQERDIILHIEYLGITNQHRSPATSNKQKKKAIKHEKLITVSNVITLQELKSRICTVSNINATLVDIYVRRGDNDFVRCKESDMPRSLRKCLIRDSMDVQLRPREIIDVDVLNTELIAARAEIDALNRRVQQILIDTHYDRERLKKLLKVDDTQFGELQKRCEAQSIEIATERSNNEDLRRQCDLLRRDNERMTNKMKTLRSTNERMNNETTVLRRDNERMNTEIRTLKGINERMNTEIGALRRTNEHKNTEMSTLREQCQEYKAESEKATELLSQTTQALEEVMNEAYSIRNVNMLLHNTIATQQKIIGELQSERYSQNQLYSNHVQQSLCPLQEIDTIPYQEAFCGPLLPDSTSTTTSE